MKGISVLLILPYESLSHFICLYCSLCLPYLFLLYLTLAITANCIWEIHCLAVDGFNLNTVH